MSYELGAALSQCYKVLSFKYSTTEKHMENMPYADI